MSETDFLHIVTEEFPKEKSPNLLTEYRQMEGWNSLNALIFVNRLKEKSGILISPKNLSETKSLGELFRLIA